LRDEAITFPPWDSQDDAGDEPSHLD